MTNENTADPTKHLETWLKSAVYKENIDFWERVWNMVKVPYTQLPDLPYLTSIPAGLRAAGVKRVLDLGCGSGWLSIFLAREQFLVTGVDVAAHAIELARQWADKEDLKVSFDVYDIAALPYPASSFDSVVANSIFEHLTAELARATMQKLKEILVPGGTLFACFDKVGSGPGEYYLLDDGTHVYTDKGRRGMLLRNFSDEELSFLLADWHIIKQETLESGSRIVWART